LCAHLCAPRCNYANKQKIARHTCLSLCAHAFTPVLTHAHTGPHAHTHMLMQVTNYNDVVPGMTLSGTLTSVDHPSGLWLSVAKNVHALVPALHLPDASSAQKARAKFKVCVCSIMLLCCGFLWSSARALIPARQPLRARAVCDAPPRACARHPALFLPPCQQTSPSPPLSFPLFCTRARTCLRAFCVLACTGGPDCDWPRAGGGRGRQEDEAHPEARPPHLQATHDCVAAAGGAWHKGARRRDGCQGVGVVGVKGGMGI